MTDNLETLKQLSQACLTQADRLLQFEIDADFKGDNITTLHANEMALRTKVLLLNTSIVQASLDEAAPAIDKLNSAIKEADKDANIIKNVQIAIQISADLIAIAASALSGNPGSIASTSAALIKDVIAAIKPDKKDAAS